MQPEQRRILFIVLIVIVVVLAITLGLVFGLRKSDDEENTEPEVDIMNSYDNTAELIKKFPVNNSTKVLPGLEEHIQNRLLTGFENWNRGFKAWKAWGNILYTKDSIYNVHGARLTLEHYQVAMDQSLKQMKIFMGDFHNMLISDQYCGIHYDFITERDGRRKVGKVMEFVKFHELGTDEKPDTRVEEGWGSVKDDSYDGLIRIQGEDEKKNQTGQDEYNLNYQFPETDDLTKKYVIKYPTTYIDDNYQQILDIILNGFESWNKGLSYYLDWVDNNFDANAFSSSIEEVERNMTQYKAEITELFQNNTITKLYFDNFLIRDNWAAIHYRYRKENYKGSEKYVGDRMEFFKFEGEDQNLKIVANFVQ